MTFLDPRFWLACAIALAAAFGLGYFKGNSHGKDSVRVEWRQATADADSEARRLERARQSAADSAARLAAARESGIRAAALGARRESDGLRDDLRAANEYASQSRAAAERVAGLATDLLGRCEASYLSMAEAAARADSEARQLRQAWPR